MDKESVQYVYNRILLNHKEWNNAFAASWLVPEIIIPSQGRTNITWYHLCVESEKKNDRNELIYKTEIDSERKQTYGYQKGKVGRDKLGILD